MKPVAARLDSWIHAFVPVTPEGLAICWIVFAAFRTRLVSVVLTMAWMLGDSVRFSFGKIDCEMIVVAVPAIMAFARIPDRFRVPQRRRAEADDMDRFRSLHPGSTQLADVWLERRTPGAARATVRRDQQPMVLGDR
jgi:hypothetical protein